MKCQFHYFVKIINIFVCAIIITNAYSQSTWEGWENLGAPSNGITSRIVVSNNADGRLEIFTIAEDRKLWHKWQSTTNNMNNWSPWVSLGAPDGIQLKRSLENNLIAAEINFKNEIEVFVCGDDGSIWAITQKGSSGNQGWNKWFNLSKAGDVVIPGREQRLTAPTTNVADIAIGKNADGRLELFIKNGDDNQIWHTWQRPGSQSPVWAGVWAKMVSHEEKSIDKFVIGSVYFSSKRLKQEIIAITGINSNNISFWNKSQNVINGGWKNWGNLARFPAQNSFGKNVQLAVGYNEDSRTEIFVTDGNSYYHIWQLKDSNNEPNFLWHNEWGRTLGKPRTNGNILPYISATLDISNCQHLFTIAADPNWGAPFQPRNEYVLWHIYQTKSNKGWGQWQVVTDLPAPNNIIQLNAAYNVKRSMEVFVVGTPPTNRGEQPNQVSVWRLYQK